METAVHSGLDTLRKWSDMSMAKRMGEYLRRGAH